MKRLMISVAALLLLVVPQLAFGTDLDDLKAADAQATKAFNSLDAATIASTVYPGGVYFGATDAFPTLVATENTVAQHTNLLKTLFGSLDYLFVVPYNIQYKVVGNTGIVWGHETVLSKAKGGQAQTRHYRVTTTWVKSDGKWMVFMVHQSAIPSGE
jgi:ketosteroid isomerase-like protein